MMSRTLAKQEMSVTPSRKGSRFDRWARNFLCRHLHKLTRGRIQLLENGGCLAFGEDGAQAALQASVNVMDPRFYGSLLLGGSVGAGEAYMAGHWTCNDLTALLRIILRNRFVLEGMEGGLARLAVPARKLYHWLRRNTPAGSKRNISAHYDLGNDFYKLFLDDTLTYSCGIFEGPNTTLKEASLAKYDRICRKLDLREKDHVVEIGTGWGGFALHAAKHYGCRVTTTTLSREQYAYARERIEEQGLTQRIRLLNQDYRSLGDTYDKLVSIEMVEAVGYQFLKTFLGKISVLLKPEGKAALQAITIEDQRYKQHVRKVDFIKRYIFPGSCLLSVTSLCDTATRATDLRLFHLEDITPHYATTLREWRNRFLARLDEVRAMGFPESFIRMWEFYLCYCEAAFAEHYIGDVQAVFFKPLCREAVPLAAFPGSRGTHQERGAEA